VVTQGTVEKHVRGILTKLDLPETHDDHRRVLAVLTCLEGHQAVWRGSPSPVLPRSSPMARADRLDLDSNPAAGLAVIRSAKSSWASVEIKITLDGSRAGEAAGKPQPDA